MFVLKSALVHYGVRSYPLNGLPSQYNRIESAEQVCPERLTHEVGLLTQYPRQFTVRHIPAQVIELGDQRLELPEKVYAQANGYSITWIKE